MTAEGVWEHFETVIVPAIQTWQLNNENEESEETASRNLGKLLDKCLETVSMSDDHLSEVGFALTCVSSRGTIIMVKLEVRQ